MSVRALGTNLLVAVGALLVAIALGEVALWGAGYDYSPLTIQDMTVGRDDRRSHVFDDTHFVSDPYLIWRPRASESVFNAQGFRGRELESPKPDGQLRVFTIGDSNTLGRRGAGGPHWPATLERRLRRIHPDAVVTNAGVWGYSSFQGLRRFRLILEEYEPDIILVSFGSNDAHMVRVADDEYAAGALRRSPFLVPLQQLRSGRLLLSWFDRRTMQAERPLRPRVSPQQYRDNLTEFIRLARENDVSTVLLTRPYIGTTSDPTWWKNFGADYHAVAIEVAEKEHVALIDIYSLFKLEREVFSDESHFNDVGHEMAGDLIFERVQGIVLDGE